MATRGDPIWPDVEYEPEQSVCCSAPVSEDDTCTECKRALEVYQILPPYPVSWEDEDRWLEEFYADQPEEGIKGCIVGFPVGDGKAMYKVTKLRPLTLSPIVSGDRWEIPDAHMRGLRKEDIEHMVNFGRKWSEMAGRSREQQKVRPDGRPIIPRGPRSS